ncbi:MAG: DUF3108 domain-containing protein [Alphaproteobacteria bacterium]
MTAIRQPASPLPALSLPALASLLLSLLLLTGPSSARASDSLALKYSVFAYGLPAMNLDVAIDQNPSAYAMRVEAETKPVIGLIARWSLQAVTVGRVSDAASTAAVLWPEYQDMTSVWRREPRHQRMDFLEGGNVSVSFNPDRNIAPEETVPADQLAGAVDPMTAVLSLVRAVASGEGCRATGPIFDGRRLYAMDLTDLGERNMASVLDSSLSGVAVGCRMERRHLAGKSLNDDGKERAVDVWFMRPSADLPVLPVYMETGGAFGFQMHLRQAEAVAAPTVVTRLPE